MGIEQTLIFVDGENLVCRYEEMVKEGHIPRSDNIHIPGCFVWNQRVLNDHLWRIKRLSYYTSVVGDENRVTKVRKEISATQFVCTTESTREIENKDTGQIIPFVRKKSNRSRKESICDIAIAVDVMRACYRDHAETVWIFSGDGDFVQLLEEVVHSGKRAYVSAFSSGFNEELRYVVDEFLPLEKYFFLSPEEAAAATITDVTEPTTAKEFLT